ncbi:hypothetical protein BKA69DRAFT_1096448 [Paraphysoderma sedebokerense]|nr:hypothetical protein BKA69DRAFT_1096448 [Paraphysoderma sedebokerense]
MQSKKMGSNKGVSLCKRFFVTSIDRNHRGKVDSRIRLLISFFTLFHSAVMGSFKLNSIRKGYTVIGFTIIFVLGLFMCFRSYYDPTTTSQELKRYFSKDHDWLDYKCLVCSTENGVNQTWYTYDCNVTHSNLQEKTALAWNNVPTGYDFYFKVDNDVLLNISILERFLRFYSRCNKDLLFGWIWRPRYMGFFLSGMLYGTSKPYKYNVSRQNDELNWSAGAPKSYFVVDWTHWFCGRSYGQLDDGRCKYLATHKKCGRNGIYVGCPRSVDNFSCESLIPVAALQTGPISENKSRSRDERNHTNSNKTT